MIIKSKTLSNPTSQELYKALIPYIPSENTSFKLLTKTTHFNDLLELCRLLNFDFQYVIGEKRVEYSNRSHKDMTYKENDWIMLIPHPQNALETVCSPIISYKVHGTRTYDNFTFENLERAFARIIRDFGSNPKKFSYTVKSASATDLTVDNITIKRSFANLPKFDSVIELKFQLNLRGILA